jgi:hypothetical protein
LAWLLPTQVPQYEQSPALDNASAGTQRQITTSENS